MSQKRDRVDEIAEQHLAAGDAKGWFDALYREANGNFDVIPWADRQVNPHLRDWCEREGLPRPDSRAVVVGCGLGDDAEYLASRGAIVTAFDLSPAAIAWCRSRYPDSKVDYRTADLLDLPAGFLGQFDLVAECYTLQAMPQEFRAAAVQAVAGLLAPEGDMVIICRGRDASDPPGRLPWPLTKADLDSVPFTALLWEDFDDPYEPGKRRFRGHWRR